MSVSASRPSSTPGSATWTPPACWSTRSAAYCRPPRAAWARPSRASATPWPTCAWPSPTSPPTPRSPSRSPTARRTRGSCAHPAAYGSLARTDTKGPAWGGALPTLRDAGRQRTEGPSCSCSLRKRPHVRGLRALGPVGDLELDGLALVEGLVAVALDGREVDEDVVAAVAGDEAVALLVAEPLDGAFRQRASLLSTPAASTPVAEACRPGRADCTATPSWAQAQPKCPKPPGQATILEIGSSRMSKAPAALRVGMRRLTPALSTTVSTAWKPESASSFTVGAFIEGSTARTR